MMFSYVESVLSFFSAFPPVTICIIARTNMLVYLFNMSVGRCSIVVALPPYGDTGGQLGGGRDEICHRQ